MKTTSQTPEKKGRAKHASTEISATKKPMGRPRLPLTDEERARKLAEQNKAANRKMRERVHYVSVPLEKNMFEWLEAERAELRPIPAQGRLIIMLLEEKMLEAKPKPKKRSKA